MNPFQNSTLLPQLKHWCSQFEFAQRHQNAPRSKEEAFKYQRVKALQAQILALHELSGVIGVDEKQKTMAFDPFFLDTMQALVDRMDGALGTEITGLPRFKSRIWLELVELLLSDAPGLYAFLNAEQNAALKQQTKETLVGALTNDPKQTQEASWPEVKKNIEKLLSKTKLKTLMKRLPEELSTEEWLDFWKGPWGAFDETGSEHYNIGCSLIENTVPMPAEQWLNVLSHRHSWNNIAGLYAMGWHRSFWESAEFWNDKGWAALFLQEHYPLMHAFETASKAELDHFLRLFADRFPMEVSKPIAAMLLGSGYDAEGGCEWVRSLGLSWSEVSMKNKTNGLMSCWKSIWDELLHGEGFKPDVKGMPSVKKALGTGQAAPRKGSGKLAEAWWDGVKDRLEACPANQTSTLKKEKQTSSGGIARAFYLMPSLEEEGVKAVSMLKGLIKTEQDAHEVQNMWLEVYKKEIKGWSHPDLVETVRDGAELKKRVHAFGAILLPALIEGRWVEGGDPAVWKPLDKKQLHELNMIVLGLEVEVKDRVSRLMEEQEEDDHDFHDAFKMLEAIREDLGRVSGPVLKKNHALKI